VTADELNALRARAREERRPLLVELKALERGELVERLMKEPLLERLYWYETHAAGHSSKQDRKRLVQGVTDDELVDAQVLLAKVNIATARAARRHYGYKGFEPGSDEAILTEMIENVGECPLAILFHAYEHMLFAYR
jgi:hypothetical protein